jgi:hypothetical protein
MSLILAGSILLDSAFNTFLSVNAGLHCLNNVSCLFLTMNWWCENTAKICTSNPPTSSAEGLYRKLSSYWLAHFCLIKKSAKVLQKPSPAPAWQTPNRPPNIKCIVIISCF